MLFSVRARKKSLVAARRVLADVFGHSEFRASQGNAVAAVLAGCDAVVVLPTGAGKSVCYQIPARRAPPGKAEISHKRSTTIANEPRVRSDKRPTCMVFQRKVILAIDREEPDPLEALARIRSLGLAKIERFGQDVLGMVQKHRRRF